MRAFLAVMLIVANVDAQLITGKFNGQILAQLPLMDAKDHIVYTSVQAPDVVVNKYKIDKEDIAKLLKEHLEAASRDFVNLANQNLTAADLKSMLMPGDPITNDFGGINNSTQNKMQANATFNAFVAPPAGPPRITRDVMADMEIDLPGTIELYRQASEFLNQYDVELRFE